MTRRLVGLVGFEPLASCYHKSLTPRLPKHFSASTYSATVFYLYFIVFTFSRMSVEPFSQAVQALRAEVNPLR